MKHPSCGLIYGLDIHHLDHIAPLCSILSIPLICTDLNIKQLAETTYPNLYAIHIDINSLPEEISARFEVIFSCLPTQLLDPIFTFTEHAQKKKLLYVWLPHGNSDKDNLAALSTEKYLLIYGKQMHDSLKRSGVLDKVHHTTMIGNFRKIYYFANKNHFDDIAKPHINFAKRGKKTLLYAPTWGEDNLSESTYSLLTQLPDDYNLIVKFHPNTLYTGFAIALKEAFSERDNIKFVDDLPLIYPLLSISDIYIGDHSSIAYDFLSLYKPLYFFTEEKTPIHLAGKITTPQRMFIEIENDEDQHKEVRQTLDEYAFEPTPILESLPTLIEQGIENYFAKEPHVLE